MPDSKIAERLGRYATELMKINEFINLTGAKTEEEFTQKHTNDIVEAACAYEEEHEFGDEIWDVGSGGGVPGIPLAILKPKLKVVLIERRERKAQALEDLVSACGLSSQVEVRCKSFETIHDRKPHVECWFRGFLPAPKLIEYFSRDIREEKLSRIVLMKGPSWAKELQEALTLQKINQEWLQRFEAAYTVEYSLAGFDGKRSLVFI